MTDLLRPIIHPPRADLPVLLSVPHSGRHYAPALLAESRGGREALASLEDPLVDRLVWRAVQRGCGAVIAVTPRAAIDCNRAEDELDPAVIEGADRSRLSPRARGGLGIVPSRTQAHGHLWRRPIAPAELQRRIDLVHRPYHEAIAGLLDELLRRFGCALLLDCHSMPPPPLGVPPIVFGDCHGGSAGRWIAHEAAHIARAHGFDSSLNDPFAGGHVVARHGRPRERVHALQIEIDRRCYLEKGEPGPSFDRCARLIEALAETLGQALVDRQAPLAAE